MNLALAFVVGVCFGALLQRVGASRHELILGTLRLRDLTILKFMLLAIGVAAVGTGVLASFGQAHFAIKPLYVAGVLLGGLVFGVGFALSGYCPGTCLVASAEGRRDAWFTVGGGFLGALAYALAFPVLKPALVDRWNLGSVTLGKALHWSAGAAGIGIGVLVVALALVLPQVPGARRAQAPSSPAHQGALRPAAPSRGRKA
jgi:uncharacterized protein